MNSKIIETLLHMMEGQTHDFKSEQYKFKRALKNEKSELLKDIIAFANTWKKTDAYILIGVEEQKGKRAIIRGVTEHFDDADIQQFVNSKTNTPVHFKYEVVTIDGLQVDIITINQSQNKPIYLNETYDKLKKNTIYIRRGSSTDEAAPEEIAQMGAESVRKEIAAPMLELEFANPSKRERHGKTAEVVSTVFIDPPPINMESLKKLVKTSGIAEEIRKGCLNDILPEPRPRLWRHPSPQKLRGHRQLLALISPLGFWLKNTGAVASYDTQVELRGSNSPSLCVLDETNHPEYKKDELLGLPTIPVSIKTDLKVNIYDTYWIARLDVGKLQPGQEIWVDDYLYVGSKESTSFPVDVMIFSDNLASPIEISLQIDVKAKEEIYMPENWNDREGNR